MGVRRSLHCVGERTEALAAGEGFEVGFGGPGGKEANYNETKE